MAELPNRDDFEARFAKSLAKVARRHRRELVDYLGNPPSLDNVPEKFWTKFRAEVEAAVYADLYSTYMAAAEYHGWRREPQKKALGDMFRRAADAAADVALSAFGWAKKRAEEFAKYWTTSTRERLRQGLEESAKPLVSDPDETIAEHRAANVPGAEQQSETISDASLKELLDETFGATRIVAVSEDEVTRARHAGAEDAIEATVGLSEDDIWEINPPRVCKVCLAVNGFRRRDWPLKLRSGPPIHPRCKCNVRYANRDGQGSGTPRNQGPNLSDDERMEAWFDRIRGQKSRRRKNSRI